MTPLLRAPLALVLLLATAFPSLGAETESLDFTIRGLKIGTVSLTYEDQDGGYSAASRIETAGIVGVFADFFFDGRATGRLSGDKVVPGLYTATSKSPRATRETRIEWKNGTPVTVSVEPPRSSAPDPAKQGGTLDPISAGFALLREVPVSEACGDTVLVFDGSRLSRLKLAPPARDGATLVCEGAFARIEGEAHSLTDVREFPFRLVFDVVGDRARLQRIEAPTNFGQAVITRRS